MARGGFLSLPDLDPAVDAALVHGNRRQSEAHMPKDQRAKVARQRAKDARRNRFNMDLDPNLDNELCALADQLRCPTSGLAELAIYLMLQAVSEGFDLTGYLIQTRSPRYEHVVKVPTLIPDNSSSSGSP